MLRTTQATIWICLLALVLVPVTSWAIPSPQQDESATVEQEETDTEATEAEEDAEPADSFFEATTVTATGTEVDVFSIATPVAVIPEEEIEKKLPENAVDLFRAQPGVDVNGVGPNQARPIIRGQRGLRVLFMENGLRLNNARRQSDFGEISGLIDMGSVGSVEVLRGPASVLYGTDAIGGVLNLVTKSPAYGDGSWVAGSLGLGYTDASDGLRAQGYIQGRQEKWAFNLGATYRDSSDYLAAGGSYGDITLPDDTPVNDTGLQDDSIYGFLSYDFTDSQLLSFRFNRYRAGETGFGWVDPLLLGELDRVQITYPFQDFDRYTMEYNASALQSVLANTARVNLLYQENQRELVNNIDAYSPFSGPLLFHIGVTTENFTDLSTLGLRAEASKILGDNHLLSYGGEYYDDDSFNTDYSFTYGALAMQMDPTLPPEDITPPFFTDEDDIANTPNAENIAFGLFAQDQFLLGSRFSGTVGIRYANTETKAKETSGLDTAGLDFSDDDFVGAVSGVYQATNNLNLVGTLGTAFRAPNIVERLFNGLTPEGSGYQILNPDLQSETSLNWDLGLKYRRMNAIFEIMIFRNEITDGIVQEFLSDEEIAQLPPDVQEEIENSGAGVVVQQQNASKLRYEGVETTIGWRGSRGFSIGANYTYLDSERVDTGAPTGDTYNNKFNFNTRYDRPTGRFWVEYRLRHNGSADAVTDPDAPIPPVGETLPAFTIHTLSGGVVLFERASQQHSLTLVIDNFTDELYSEFSNATFFRPQPRRNFLVTYRLRI
jgi:hemoglobin/transferrin/lactoferrin receptor protein